MNNRFKVTDWNLSFSTCNSIIPKGYMNLNISMENLSSKKKIDIHVSHTTPRMYKYTVEKWNDFVAKYLQSFMRVLGVDNTSKIIGSELLVSQTPALAYFSISNDFILESSQLEQICLAPFSFMPAFHFFTLDEYKI